MGIEDKQGLDGSQNDRWSRRWSKRYDEKHGDKFGGRLKQLSTQVDQTLTDWRNVVARSGGDFSPLVYREAPALLSYLEARYKIPLLFEDVYWIHRDEPEAVQTLEAAFVPRDIFQHPTGESWLTNGTTIADIEAMPVSNGRLSAQDIRRINSIFHTGPSMLRHDAQDFMAQCTIVALATQDLARPYERIRVSDKIKLLQERLRAYFNYYMSLLTDFSLSDQTEKNFVDMLKFGKPRLLQALAVYGPAYLGITPSSAIKLYRERALASSQPANVWNQLFPVIEQTTKGAYRENNLPQDLFQYQQYDPEMDARAANQLTDYYSLAKSTHDPEKTYVEVQKLQERLGFYRKLLQRSIVNPSGQRRLVIEMPRGSFATAITVTSQYPDSLMFILHLDGQVHLTLDLGRNGKLYGLPPQLVHQNPHLLDSVLVDMLQPLLAKLSSTYPGVEKVSSPMPKQVREIVDPGKAEPRIEESSYTRRVREGRRSKPKVMTPVAQVLAGPKPEDLPVEAKRQNHVSYDGSLEDVVNKFVGNKIPQDIRDAIMRDIIAFEYGRRDTTKLNDTELWELKSTVGHSSYRILFNSLGGKTYVIENIIPRRDLTTSRFRKYMRN